MKLHNLHEAGIPKPRRKKRNPFTYDPFEKPAAPPQPASITASMKVSVVKGGEVVSTSKTKSGVGAANEIYKMLQGIKTGISMQDVEPSEDMLSRCGYI